MSKELKLLNLVCVLLAIGFLAVAVLSLLTAGDLLTTDTLFFATVCLVMALIFAVNPLLYLHSQGKLPVPFLKTSSTPEKQITAAPTAASKAIWVATGSKAPPLLDAKGRAVPPDVRAMVSRMGQAEPKDA